MLITQLKAKETIEALANGKVVIINCHGCKEVYFPEPLAEELQNDLSDTKDVIEIITRDYICNPDNLKLQLKKYMAKISLADTILVFSCGVGIQTVADLFEDKRVYSCCDTYPLPGFQGVTPLEFNCAQCGECHLNFTGGICPISSCSKSLVNGQCGGAKNGMCEVDKEMECGWERIYRKLEKLDKLAILNSDGPKVRNFGKPDADDKKE